MEASKEQIDFNSLSDLRYVRASVPRPLTDEQKISIADTALDLSASITTMEQQLKEYAHIKRDEIKTLKARHTHYVNIYQSGVIESEENVTIGYDWKSQQKYLLCESDGAIIGPFPLDERDQQIPLPLAEVHEFPKAVEEQPEFEPEPEPEPEEPDEEPELPAAESYDESDWEAYPPEAMLRCSGCKLPVRRKHLIEVDGRPLCFVCKNEDE